MRKNVLCSFRRELPLLSLFFTISLFIYACSNDSAEDIVEEIIEEEVEIDTVFYGEYSGGWSSNAANGSVYSRIDASIIIHEGSGESWTGEFFFTRNHVPCCGGVDNNGTISFDMQDSVITNFRYVDTIPGCNGTFTGEGVLDEDGDIIIQFTGNDCEGDHTDGLLELSK